MKVNISGAQFDVPLALAADIESAIARAAYEVQKVWGDDISDAESQRKGGKNIIRAYLDRVR